MSAGKKLAGMMTGPNNWSLQELQAVADYYGIKYAISRTGGSHWTFSYPNTSQSITIAANNGKSSIPAAAVERFCSFAFSVSTQAVQDCASAVKKNKPLQLRMERMLSARRSVQDGHSP